VRAQVWYLAPVCLELAEILARMLEVCQVGTVSSYLLYLCHCRVVTPAVVAYW